MPPEMTPVVGVGVPRGSLVSPTTLTTAIPRPHSPRRPNYRPGEGGGGGGGGGGLLTAESFHRTYRSKIPSIRRRPHHEIGSFDKGVGEQQHKQQQSQQRGPRQQHQVSQPPLMCSTIDFLNINEENKNCNTPSTHIQKGFGQSKEYAKRYAPVAQSQLGACVSNTNYVAGQAAGKAGEVTAEFAMTAAEVYRQECKSDNRGEDSMFFQQQSQNQLTQEVNSLVGNDSSGTSENESERRDSKSTSPMRRKKRRQRRRNSNSGSGNSKHSGSRSRSNSRSTRSNRGQPKFPDAIYMMKVGSGDTRDRSFSPPKVDRINTANDTFDPSNYKSRTGMAPESHRELREARMQLFKMGQNSPSGEMMSDPGTRLKLALQDLDRQDGIIDGLKKQLRMNQKSLDEMVAEAKQAKALAQQKQYKATEAQARSVQERKRLEDMYERELEQNKKLDSVVSTLQVEISTLKVNLRNARSEGKNSSVLSPKNPQSPSHPTKQESAQQISLRAEIVDLRSQLAEAKALNILDNSSLREVEELKKKLEIAESDILAYKAKAGNLQQVEEKLQYLREKHKEAETKLEEELKNQKSSAEETQSKLESTLEEAKAAEKGATSELAKVKANLQRLEKERSRFRLHSAADVDRVNRQLVKAREETAKFKKQLQDEQASSKTSSTKLKAEIHDIRKKLVQANKNDVSKNAVASLKESRKLKSDQVKMTQEIKELQKQLKSKEEKIESLTSTVSRMAEKAKQVEGLMAQLEETSVINGTQDQDVSLFEAEIDQLKSNEASFHEKIKSLTTQLEEARALAAKNAHDRKDFDLLREQLEQAKSDPPPVYSPRSTSPILTELQGEIMSLKQKLSEAEAINRAFSSSSEEKSVASFQIKDHPEVVALQEENTTLRNKLEEVVESKSHAADILQRENRTLKHILVQADQKLQAALQQAEKTEKPEIRLKAMEQAYLNQISVFKARLAESETKCKDEAFRADEERRISREKDGERTRALEKLRQEKEAVDNENSNLEDTIIELRTKLASTVAAQSGNHFGVSPKPSSDSSEKVADSPKNLKRLRNELALARARLSAARDYSRSIGDMSSDSLDTSLDIITTNLEKDVFEESNPVPSSPDNSVKSQESSWAPPRSSSGSSEIPTRRLVDISISSSTNAVPSTSLLSSSLTISSSPPSASEEVSTIKGSFEIPSTNEADQPIIPPLAGLANKATRAAKPEATSPAAFPSMRNLVSLSPPEHIDASISNVTTPAVKNSALLKYKEERWAEPDGLSPATTPSITNSMSRQLQEQIHASNKRLEAANARLKDLSERPDFPWKKIFGQQQEPMEPIATKDDCRDTAPGCSSNEVSTTPSGNADVQDNSDNSIGSRSSERMSYFGLREPLQPIVTVESDRRDDGSEGIADEVVATLSGNIEVSHWKYADI